MSVYPKRIAPGDQAFVHVRIRSRLPRRPLMRVLLERPDGERETIREFQPLVLPVPAPPVPASDDAAAATGIRRTSPVYLAARHLVGADGDDASMASIIATMQQSVHFHHVLDTGADWTLGRYRIHLEMRSGGRVRASDTARDAWFALESLAIEDVRRDGVEGGRARVHNPGPLPVPARVCGLGDGEMWSRAVRFAPGTTDVAFRGARAWLLYSDDRRALHFGDASSPHVVRNEAFVWRDQPDDARVLVHGGQVDATGWTLEGAARALWLRADGLVQRHELRTEADAAAYDELHRVGLLQELTTAGGSA